MDILPNVYNSLMFSDIVAYFNNKKMYCVLCVDELNIKRNFPIHSYVRVNEIQYCDGCKAELSLRLADWTCEECKTDNEHHKEICDGCENRK